MGKIILFLMIVVLAGTLVPYVGVQSYIALKERKRKWLREDEEFNRRKLAEAKKEIEESMELLENVSR